MKTIIALLLIAVMAGCHENTESRPKAFDKSVGARIPMDVASRWIQLNLEKNGSNQGRVNNISYEVSKDHLENVLQSIPNLQGVAVHHAIDDTGIYHILIVPVDENLNRWTLSGHVIDANTNSEIDINTAKNWAKNYEIANPGQVWYHFFGAYTFDEITTNPDFQYFNIEPAINDEQNPQLLLLVWGDVNSSGRSKAEYPVAYDASSPCPCPPAP